MGLPSGTLWAPFNIGANAPEEFGEYFSWGNIDGHAEGSGYSFSEDNYNSTPGAQVQSDLPLANDMARANWGGQWTTPTSRQFQELIDNCYNGGQLTTQNGVNGMLFRSRINGNSIFLPASGFYNEEELYLKGIAGSYYTSTIEQGSGCQSLEFDEELHANVDSTNKYYGQPVRPVING